MLVERRPVTGHAVALERREGVAHVCELLKEPAMALGSQGATHIRLLKVCPQ